MKQVLIQKNDQIKELSGSRIAFYHEGVEDVRIDDRHVTKLTIPFKAKILSGGTLDLDFTLPEHVAELGISLLGAYWNGSEVTVYFRALENFARNLPVEKPMLIGTLVQVTTMKQIETEMLNGVVEVEQSGQAIVILDNKPSKRSRARRKDAR